MRRIEKTRKRLIIQASAEGDLEKLKELYKENNYMFIDEALFYAIRKCRIECAEFLLNTGKTDLSNLTKYKYNGITWEIINTKNEQSERIKTFRFLYENGIKSIPTEIVNTYIQRRNKEHFKTALKEFSKEINFKELLEENINKAFGDREDFLNSIKSEIRNEKINSIL
jgi:hypothetical protein